MTFYPINLDLTNRRCVVIGGGVIAERKVQTLMEFGAAVTVVAPDLTPRLSDLSADGSIRHVPGLYEPINLEGAFLAIAATDDRAVNEAVSSDAQYRGILVNVADDPKLCTFFLPAVVRRGDVVIAVSTSGKSPALARRIRQEIELHFGPEYGELAELLGELRDEVKARYADQAERVGAFQRILESDILDLFRQGMREEAMEKARKCI